MQLKSAVAALSTAATAAVLFASTAGVAHAADPKDLGAATIGVPLTFGGLAPVGSFMDTFTFTLPTNGGSGYSVANFDLLPATLYKTIFSSISLFSDVDATAWNGNETLLTSATASGSGASLSWGASAAGHYILTVGGAGAGSQGGIYTGAISVSAVSAVPEPETYAMMLAGLVAVAFLARRRHNG